MAAGEVVFPMFLIILQTLYLCLPPAAAAAAAAAAVMGEAVVVVRAVVVTVAAAPVVRAAAVADAEDIRRFTGIELTKLFHCEAVGE